MRHIREVLVVCGVEAECQHDVEAPPPPDSFWLSKDPVARQKNFTWSRSAETSELQLSDAASSMYT